VKIATCSEIEDFSCLGSQHYLELEELNQLKTENISRFGNIPFLKVSKCGNIVKVDQLNRNKFLYFVECSRLQTVELQGDQYLNVSFESCPELRQLTITGKVAKQTIRDCPNIQFTFVNYYRNEED
jgi:hypothetical protein